MTSNRPYLLRALYEWVLDNNMTPHILVNATFPGTVVPEEFVEDGRIVLNIAPQAVRDLCLGERAVQFHARFGGRSLEVHVPVAAVLGIYARESGKGMVFPAQDEAGAEDGVEARQEGRKPTLTVVK